MFNLARTAARGLYLEISHLVSHELDNFTCPGTVPSQPLLKAFLITRAARGLYLKSLYLSFFFRYSETHKKKAAGGLYL